MSLAGQITALAAAVAAQFKTLRRAYTPPSGSFAMPPNVLSVAAASPAAGTLCLFPIDVGPTALTITGFAVNVTTARSGGTGTLVKCALYADDGTGGKPVLSPAGLLASADITAVLSTIGVKQPSTAAPMAAPITLPPGRYWVGLMNYAGTTAPTTPAAYSCASNGTSLWATNSTFTATRFLYVTGLTDVPVAGQSITPQANSTGAVVALVAA